MARGVSTPGKPMNVRVDGLRELATLHPDWIDTAQEEHLQRAAREIAAEIALRAPGGASGSIGRTVVAKTLNATTATVLVTHPGAKAQERGAYIKPKRTALRFRDGGYSRRPVRLPATRFASKGLRKRGKIIRDTYKDAFGNIEKTARNAGRATTMGGL